MPIGGVFWLPVFKNPLLSAGGTPMPDFQFRGESWNSRPCCVTYLLHHQCYRGRLGRGHIVSRHYVDRN
jgi:hypothetical protein